MRNNGKHAMGRITIEFEIANNEALVAARRGYLDPSKVRRKIISGLLRRNPSVDVVRAQEVGLTGVDDRILLEWAAQNHAGPR